ncbi:Clavaminate synthase-like protein [Epithele typhae]|uniref:Clavaminate synthase-like protein n=1 Tax=Epithele typhae TaxID=378194 RepID=UPI002007A831|nr:Clavaminate synthase-like protein [Epithele typhae]KAH9919166.1 Clavaminate synthase-like protein [Epithele typhae]
MPGLTSHPPFPQDIPTCPESLAGDADEIERLWKAAKEMGFWYLCEESEGMFAMGEETIALTLAEKLLFEQGDQCSTITPFVKINNHIIDFLNDKLALSTGTLAGCTARFIRPPSCIGPEEKTFLTAHTDFGSLVLPPSSDQWFYVKPVRGHAICNISDALDIFSGGILRSNIHRVVPPPREQAQYERHSVMFFPRPNATVELRAMSAQSERIAAYAPGVTAMEWLVRRVNSQRVTNYKVCPVSPRCAQVAKG